MAKQISIDIQVHALPDELTPYFNTFYTSTILDTGGEIVEDRFQPEWASLRVTESSALPFSSIQPDELKQVSPFGFNGPTSRAANIGFIPAKFWTLSFQPLGWAKFLDGPASAFADQIVDGEQYSELSALRPVADIIRQDNIETGLKVRRVFDYLMTVDRPAPKNVEAIRNCGEALRDPDVSSVSGLLDRTGLERRTLERLCARYFGFSPKMLLRRQRFLRSLARFSLEGGDKWTNVLDGQYVDQSHFVRDFRQFMGTTPSEYAEEPHPIMKEVLAQRIKWASTVPDSRMPTMLKWGQSKRRQD